MPALDPPHGVHPEFIGGWPSLHGSLILLAYGAFGLASVAALMYLTQEHDLKFHKLRAIFSSGASAGPTAPHTWGSGDALALSRLMQESPA